jgi:tRNA_anti-like
MGSKKKYLLLFLTGIVLLAAGAGFYFYNKPAVDIKDANGLKVFATSLYETFTKDSVVAKKEYTNKILEVSGMVTLITENQQHQPLVLLKTNIGGAAVNCTLEGPVGAIKVGSSVSIKGICNGIGEGDADLGIIGDVYLVRCYVLK